MSKFIVLLVALVLSTAHAFTVPSPTIRAQHAITSARSFVLHMSEPVKEEAPAVSDPMEEEELDTEAKLALEKARRADELRAQEVFMKRGTGKHVCTNCDWEYDESKGDSMMIGGMVKPGTKFEDLPSNWRCPVCRASKDSFTEQVEEIPGFEVNQGYGFGGNSMTSGQKNLVIFGGLGFFFLLFLSGYALS